MLRLLGILSIPLVILFLAWAAPPVLGIIVMALLVYHLIIPYSPDPPPY